MPWTPSYTPSDLEKAVASALTWRDVVATLDLRYHGRTLARLRKWAEVWGVPVDHLTDNRGQVKRARRYSEDELRAAVAGSVSWAETLRVLGMCPSGGNWKTIQRDCESLEISTAHFDPYATNREAGRKRRIPLAEILTTGSSYSRGQLKERLYDAGLKERHCELCGQGELWRGDRISLILDHINGIRDDNRLSNLRIVCPNCAAAFETHCGRKNRREPPIRACAQCGLGFRVKYRRQRFCSRACAGTGRAGAMRGTPRPSSRKVERPPLAVLRRETAELGFSATGRKYGVSDNAVRKWLIWYEHEAAAGDRALQLDRES